jgi:hypothetical protein
MRRALLLSLLLAPHVGCDDSNPKFWQKPNDLLPLVALDDRVAYVEKNSQTAFLLDPADPSFKPAMVGVCKAPVLAVKRNQANKMIVLCRGDSGSSTVKAVSSQLQVIDAATAASTTYDLVGRYDGLAQSSTGRFAVLYHTSAQATSDSGLFNPNEMTVVDFDTPSPDSTPPTDITLKPKSIRSLGGSPQRIEFSTLGTFPSGKPRQVAVVLSQNYVTIFDLVHPSEDEISVPLCAQSTNCAFDTKQILFEDTLNTPSKKVNVYVRAGNSSDIFQVAVAEIADPNGGPPVLHASLSMLSVGATPDAMALYQITKPADLTNPEKVVTKLAVLSSTGKRLVIIDPTTSHTLSITTAIPVDAMVPFTVTTANSTKTEALLVDTLHGNKSVLFADLEQVETTGGLAVTDYPLSAAASEVHAIDKDLVVLMAGKYAAGTALTVMTLSSRSSTDIAANSQLGSPYFESFDGSPTRMWSAYQNTGLTYLNLTAGTSGASLVTNLVWLDQGISGIQALAGAGLGTPRYVVVSHPDPDNVGNITFLNANAPDRATARTAYGFLYTNYLLRAQP